MSTADVNCSEVQLDNFQIFIFIFNFIFLNCSEAQLDNFLILRRGLSADKWY
jgi:hypothetical protein